MKRILCSITLMISQYVIAGTFVQHMRETIVKPALGRLSAITPAVGVGVGLGLLAGYYATYYLGLEMHGRKPDQELQALFDKLKDRFDIPSSVQLRIVDDPEKNYSGLFVSVLNLVVLNVAFLKGRPHSYLIFVLLHELTHAEQHYKAYGVYHSDSNNSDNDWNLEQSAEAGAAGMMSCYKCLHEVAGQDLNLKNEGYFGPDDYKPYIDTARCDGALCKAHEVIAAGGPICYYVGPKKEGVVYPETAKLEHYVPKLWQDI